MKKSQAHRGWTQVKYIHDHLRSHTEADVTAALIALKRRKIIESMYDDTVLNRLRDEIKTNEPLSEVPDDFMHNAGTAIKIYQRPALCVLYRLVPGYRVDVHELTKKAEIIDAISAYLDDEFRHGQPAIDEDAEHRKRIAATAVVQLGICVRFTQPVRQELRRDKRRRRIRY